MIRDHHFILPSERHLKRLAFFASIVNVLLFQLRVDLLPITLPVGNHFNTVAVVDGVLGIRCRQPLQLLFQTDYTVRQLLVDQLSLLNVSTHALFKLVECHQCGIGRSLGSHPVVFVFIYVDHLICCVELLAHLHLQMLHYVCCHCLLFKFGHLPLLVLNELLEPQIFGL